MSTTIVSGHLLCLLRAYQAPKHGLVTLSNKETLGIHRHPPEQVMIAKTVKGHIPPPMADLHLEDLPPLATTVITEEDRIQTRTDLTHQTPGTKPLGAMEMEEAVEEVAEEAEEGAAAEEIMETRTPKTLTLLRGGEPQRNGKLITS